MIKRIFSILFVVCIFSGIFNVSYGVEKQDIINYVNSQSVCGDVSLFNTYKSTFTRMLKQKSLTETELNTIYSYLKKAVGILNNKNVCKLSDLGKLTEAEKSSVYSSLTSGASIITKAPSVEMSEGIIENNKNNLDTNKDNNVNQNSNVSTLQDSKTNVTINTKDNTMDIYENGILMDKVSLSAPKMTYTGPNLSYLLTYIITFLICILSGLAYFVLYNKHTAKLSVVKNILFSCITCSFCILVITVIFGDELLNIKNMINLVSFENNKGSEVEVEINEDKSIKRYPSYGFKYATLEIPELNISSNVYFGDSDNILSLGIGHATSSDMPTENGVVIFSGHNNSKALNNLKNVNVGTEIVVDTTYAKCTYIVKKTNILADTEYNKLTKIEDEETLILYTCYPFDSYIYSNQRFVVYSTLKEIIWK